MPTADWLPRSLKPTLLQALADTPVVCLLGARQVGKTSLARQLEPDFAYISLDEANTRRFAAEDPDGFVASLPDPVILDEVQRVPELLLAIKHTVDANRHAGHFLLTGSAHLLRLPNVGESLAGRMEVLELAPLTASEQTRQPGRFLTNLLAGTIQPDLSATGALPFDELAEQVLRGGFPEAVRRTSARARTWHRQYLAALIDRDVKDIADVRDLPALQRLLELLALRNAQLLNVSNLANTLGLRRETVEHYLATAERLFLVRRLPGWHHNRAKRLVKAPKLYFTDSGLAATLADLAPDSVLEDRAAFGHALEGFVVQQLLAQAGWTAPGELAFSHYRDKDQVEVDLVIQRGRKVWGVEVKAAATLSRNAGRGLQRLADQAGKDFQGGVLLYAGRATMPIGPPNCHAVSLSRLWGG